MEIEGWYARVKVKDARDVRWVTVKNFWIDIYKNKKDSNPLFCFPILNVELIDGDKEDLGIPHSIKIKTGHSTTFQELVLSTPNQFDIQEIKQKINEEIEKWKEYIVSNHPKVPKIYTMDQTGKFVFRSSDRIKFILLDQMINIRQEGKEDISIEIDDSFDIFPTLETESDPKWIYISSNKTSLHLHCSSLDDLKSSVTDALQIHDLRKSENKS